MPARKSAKKPAKPLADQAAELLEQVMDRHDDLILTFEKDPDTGAETFHAISGKYVTACMLRKLMGQAESQKDEGSVVISRKIRKKG